MLRFRLGFTAFLLVLVLLLTGCGRAPAQVTAPQPATPALLAVQLVDERRGWGVTPSSILHTSDAGATWAASTPPGVKDLGSADASFLGADHGWVAVGGASSTTVYRTSDGGKTWTKVDIPVDGGPQLHFLDVDHGWMMVHQGVAMSSERVTLLRTADGGATWMAAAVAGPDDDSHGVPFGGDKTGIGFRDKDRGWLTGFEPVPGRAYLYRTDDAGRTWKKQDLPVPAAFREAMLTTYPPLFFSASDGLLPVIVAGEQESRVFYITGDGGATWTAASPVPSTVDNRSAWSFPDLQHGYALAGGKLYRTTDGGETWLALTPNTDLSGVTHLDFVSPQVGWAMGPGLLLKTTDGGQKWAAPHP